MLFNITPQLSQEEAQEITQVTEVVRTTMGTLLIASLALNTPYGGLSYMAAIDAIDSM
jgi:hypothetical protein